MRKTSLIIALAIFSLSVFSQITDKYVGGAIKTEDGIRDLKFPPLSDNIYRKRWIDFNKNGKKDIYEDPTRDVEDRIKDLLSQMTLEEKSN